MWKSVSASRWICLLTLAVVMLLYVSEVDSYFSIGGSPCCHRSSYYKIKGIKVCREQNPRLGCHHHAFLIITKTDKIMCVNPAAKWLKDKRDMKELDCPPVISFYPALEDDEA
ncbi:C-C motif chemokine 14-like [Dicentrarchus labrax]|uniref:C-C motif chemokine 14-like n=1 Tax=Dicentrarchus labrax TaxID=13489 RepID=UPI0021F5905B|nr:C-C motif chemokine 14-like [Dicentrarchus labrax]